MTSFPADAWITDDEVAQFRERGHLVYPGALGADEVSALAAAVDRFCARVPPNRTSSYYNYADILGLDDEFAKLVDHPRILAKIVGLIGFNIRVNHAHVNIDLPKPDDEAFSWHKDGAMAHWDLDCSPIPLYSVKAAIYLSGVESDAFGNTFLVPGSQHEAAHIVPRAGTRPDDSVPIVGPAGTVALFDPRMAHCRSPNRSSRTRVALFLQYGFRWLAPLDFARTESLAHSVGDPVRRQLLGLDVQETKARRSGNWYPQERDVPLRGALLEALGPARAEAVVGRAVRYPPGWASRPLPSRPSEYARRDERERG